MHRDEAIYARADAHAGILLTREETLLAVKALHEKAGIPGLVRDDPAARALAARLEAALTTLPS